MLYFPRHPRIFLSTLVFILLLSTVVSLSIGYGSWAGIGDTFSLLGKYLSANPLTHREEILSAVLLQLRMPRVILEVFVGINLAVAGVLLQALFRNPMAEPYTVGVSSGAALGAVIAVSLGFRETFLGVGLQGIAAFSGALGVTFCVYMIARQRGVVLTTKLLLTGLAFAAIIQAVTTLILLQFEFIRLRSVLSWTLGSFANKGWTHVGAIVPLSLAGLAISMIISKPLNVLCLGEEKAHSLGLPVERFKTLVLLISALLTGIAVAVSGIIAFAGLVVPHIMRMIVGPDHKLLIPSAAIGGALLMVYADLIVRLLSSAQEIPVGVVTSVFGGIIFIQLLRSSKRDII